MSKTMKSPDTRTLWAEPLEERLPISSSAAGVLFGLGLANDTTTAAYEAPQKVHTESSAQQPTLIDLTLDLQLDALAVDLFHREESLLDTISAASEDPFVLTPLTPSADLGDTITDAHRELGDELLLFQISTLDFTQVSFEPVTPYRESVSHDFGDALTPPEDLTAYGYSPIANELEEEDGGMQMSCCGGPGNCGCVSTPYVHAACLSVSSGSGCSPSGVGATWNSVKNGYDYTPTHQTLYVFQNGDTVSVNTIMYVAGAAASAGSIVITTPGYDDYWTTLTTNVGSTTLSKSLKWTKPAEVSNEDALREFTFKYSVTGGNADAFLKVFIVYLDLDIDSDNNGYINNWDKNPDRNKAEDLMEESTAKPITYFPGHLQNIPDDYKHVPLRVNAALGNATHFSFHYTDNIAVYRVGNTSPIPSNYKFPISFLEQSLGDEKFYVKAVNSGLPTYFSGNIDKIHLVLWEEINHFGIINYTEIGRDTVALKAAQTPTIVNPVTQVATTWIVPSGWHINGTSFTTPTPATPDTIGPKNEGSGVLTNSGDAYLHIPKDSQGQYEFSIEDGFTLEFNYSFVREKHTNGYPDGYVRPDHRIHDEVYDGPGGNDLRAMNFFGNSGVKIFGIYEIQLFDSQAMIAGMSLTSSNVTGGKINNKTVDGKLYDGIDINTAISGIPYGVGSYDFSDLQTITQHQGQGAHMKIEFRKVATDVYKIRVFINQVLVFYDDNVTVGTKDEKDPQNPNATRKVPFSSISDKNAASILLQSHWGSGVTFSNVIFNSNVPSNWTTPSSTIFD